MSGIRSRLRGFPPPPRPSTMNLPLNTETYIICSSDKVRIITGTSAFARVNYYSKTNHARIYTYIYIYIHIYSHHHIFHTHSYAHSYLPHTRHRCVNFLFATHKTPLCETIYPPHKTPLCETTYSLHTRHRCVRLFIYHTRHRCVELFTLHTRHRCVELFIRYTQDTAV